MTFETVCMLVLLIYSCIVTVVAAAYRSDAKMYEKMYYDIGEQMDDMFEM